MRETNDGGSHYEETRKDAGEAWRPAVFSDAVYYPEPRSHAGGDTLNRLLSMPKPAIFDSRVWRGIPSLAAAPPGPETRPWHSARADSMAFLSRSANSLLPSARTPERDRSCPTGWLDFRSTHVSSTENVSSSHRITPRSTTFCSSRMLPGQSYAWKSSSVFFLIWLILFPALLAYRSTKYSTKRGMSSFLSRRAGTHMGKTL